MWRYTGQMISRLLLPRGCKPRGPNDIGVRQQLRYLVAAKGNAVRTLRLRILFTLPRWSCPEGRILWSLGLLRGRAYILLRLYALFWLVAQVASAQPYGTVTGTVTDPEGAALPGCVIEISGPNLTTPRTVATGPDGRYQFSKITAGTYKIRASLSGFSTVTTTATVVFGQASQVNLRIAVTPARVASSPAPPPAFKGMVWVNTETKVFHREGDRWYGNTKHGKYMTEADALKAGYGVATTPLPTARATPRPTESATFAPTAVPTPAQVTTKKMTTKKKAKKAPAPPPALTPPPAPPPSIPPTPTPGQLGVVPSPPPTKEIDLFWNVWEEKGAGPKFSPVRVLRPNTQYHVYLDLSAFPYHKGTEQGVYTGVAGSSFKRWKSNWLAQSAVQDVSLQAIFLASSGFFQNVGNFVRPLLVHLSKIREASRKPLTSVLDPLAAMQQGPPEPEWQFARADFELKTRRNVGVSSVAISIWSADEDVPVEEIAVPVCIATADREQDLCKRAPPVLESLGGTDSLRVKQEGGLPAPDGAFQFLDGGAGTVFGLFHESCNECPFVKWEIQESMQSLRDRLRAATTTQIEKAMDDKELLVGGGTYYDILVPTVEARFAIAAFVAKHLPSKPPSDAQKPSLFVRMLGREFDPLVIPLGLMVVNTKGRTPFLGDYFRIEQPLSAQTYEPSEVCISRWVVSAPPPGNQELGTARTAGGAPLENWFKAATVSFEDIPTFGQWVRDDEATEPAGTGVLVLSHQSNDVIWHESQEVRLAAENVRRSFERPSLAVLDGCGFGGPDAGRFVRNFNGDGIPSIIATTASVQPKMAGDFLNCFARALAEAKEGVSLRAVYATASECLSTEKGGPTRCSTPFSEMVRYVCVRLQRRTSDVVESRIRRFRALGMRDRSRDAARRSGHPDSREPAPDRIH